MKICVYAICKNESKFIDRWYESVKEADYVCVLDTGSTDDSVEKLKKYPIILAQKSYTEFRFDIARNDSMELIPDDTDICVCVDLDEVFVTGWTQILKEHWNNHIGRVRYRYTWNFNPDGSEGVVFMADKIHRAKAYKWKYPVHEILTPITTDNYQHLDLPNIQLNHYADNTKSRSCYLPLLEQSIRENPQDDRNMHYLGREYMFYGQYEKAIKTLKKHLNLPTATWSDERCASLRYIAKCYSLLGKKKKQEEYLLRAIIEASHVREPYFEAGVMYYEQKQYLKACATFNQMLKIKDRYLNYMSAPACWGSLPYDYLSMCYYYLKDYRRAIQCVDTAIKISPDPRLLSNRNLFYELLKKTSKT